MMNLRKNKFIKIICLVLVLSFSSQQVGFADVKDLRDDSGTFGSLLSILQGYMAGRAVKPEWTVAQTWTYTYIIPTLSKQVVNMVGIKGTAGIVATTMLATFATAKLDYTASAQIDKVGLNAEKVLAKGGEGSVANAVGENVIQGAGSETLTNAVDEGTKQALKRPDGRVINHSVQNAAKGGTLSQLGNMGKALFSGGVIMKGAIIDAITTGVMVLVKKLVARMLDKTAKYIQEALSYLLAKYAGEALRIALQRRFAVLLGFSPSKGPTARGAEEDKVKVNFKDGTSQVMTTAEADALSPADVVSKEAVFQTWVLETPKELAKKQKEDDTRVIANAPIRSLGGANTKSSEIGGATITPIVSAINKGPVWHLQDVTLSEGLANQVYVFNRQSRPDDIRVITQVVFRALGMKREVAILFSAGAGSWMSGASMAEAVMRSAISVMLQKISRKFDNPLQATYLLMFVTDVAKYFITPSKNVAIEKEGGGFDIGRKDLSLLDAFVVASTTSAQIDAFTFGRAQYGGGSPYSLKWVSGNDVFFLNRYSDYINEFYDNGLNYAQTSQYMSAYHNQTVNDIYSIISGQAANTFYVKRLARENLNQINSALQRFSATWSTAVEHVIQERDKALTAMKGDLEKAQGKINDLNAKISAAKTEGERKKLQEDLGIAIGQANQLDSGIQKFNKFSSTDIYQLFRDANKQADRNNRMGILMVFLSLYDSLLASTGAASLGGNPMLKAMDQKIADLETIVQFVGGDAGERIKDYTAQLNAYKDIYKNNVEEYANLNATNGWQQLVGVSGQPYVGMSGQARNNAAKAGVQFSENPEEGLAKEPEDLLQEVGKRHIFGVATYLDIIGGNPTYYARWGKVEEPEPVSEPIKTEQPGLNTNSIRPQQTINSPETKGTPLSFATDDQPARTVASLPKAAPNLTEVSGQPVDINAGMLETSIAAPQLTASVTEPVITFASQNEPAARIVPAGLSKAVPGSQIGLSNNGSQNPAVTPEIAENIQPVNINRNALTASEMQAAPVPAIAASKIGLASEPQALRGTNEIPKIVPISKITFVKPLSPKIREYFDWLNQLGTTKEPGKARQALEGLRGSFKPKLKDMAPELAQQLPDDFNPSTLLPPEFVLRKDVVEIVSSWTSNHPDEVNYRDAFVPVFTSKEQAIAYLLMGYPVYYYSDPTTKQDASGKVAREGWANDLPNVIQRLGVAQPEVSTVVPQTQPARTAQAQPLTEPISATQPAAVSAALPQKTSSRTGLPETNLPQPESNLQPASVQLNAPAANRTTPELGPVAIKTNLISAPPMQITSQPAMAASKIDLGSESQALRSPNEIPKIVPISKITPLKPLSPQVQVYMEKLRNLSKIDSTGGVRYELEKLRGPFNIKPKGIETELAQSLPEGFDASALPPPEFVKVKDLYESEYPVGTMNYSFGQTRLRDGWVPKFSSTEQEVAYSLLGLPLSYSYDPTTKQGYSGNVARPGWASDVPKVIQRLGVNNSTLRDKSFSK